MDELAALEPLVWRDSWSARDVLHDLRPLLEGAGSRVRALYHLRLALALQYLYLDEEYAAALDAGLAAVGEDTPARTRLLLQTLDAVRARREGDYRRAQAVMEAVVGESRERGLGFVTVFTLAELAFTRSLAGDSELAFTELQDAHAAAVAQQDDFLVALVNEAYGAVYAYIDEYDKSLEHYRKALDTYSLLGYRIYEAEATFGFAISYRYARQWDRALAMFRRYGELVSRDGEARGEHGAFMSHYGLGMTYAEKGDCARALDHIGRALSAPGPGDYKAELYKRQAVCLAQAGDLRSARAAVASAREIFDGIPDLDDTHWALEVLRVEAAVEAAAGNSARAYELLLAFHDRTMALQRRQASERLMEMRVRMEDVRKDHELELLREQSRADALEIERQRSENQAQRWVTITWVMITAVVGLVLALQLRNMRRFRELSTRDGLTGLYNRRFIFQHIGKLAGALSGGRGELSLVLIDVDDFKSINDRYGHPAGDGILETIARLGRALLRPGDEMARVGGEEFLCVLPRTGPEAARSVAQRLLERIREYEFAMPDGSRARVTVSIGIASYGPGCREADSLYAAADHAMYRAKSSGKNKLDSAA